jgi:virginiamycin B lyase
VNPADFSVKGYPVPTANGYPRNLAVDGRGQIWFVEANANKIGKFIPGEELFHEYEIPTPFANPGDIAIDKHDRVWFVELNTNRIAAFYPDRLRFDEALIPTARSSPNAIVADELGNIWFLEYRGNKLGVFNPETAVFHEYPIPTFNSLPGELAIDRKRSVLWFSEGNTEARRLGSLSIDKALGKDKQRDSASEGEGASSERVLGGEGQRESTAIWLFLFASIVVAAMLFGWFRYSRGQREGTAK